MEGGPSPYPYLRVLRRSPLTVGYPDSQLMIEFDRPLDPATVDAATVALRQGSQDLQADRRLERGGRVLRIVPAAPLPASSYVTVRMTAGLKGLDGVSFQTSSVSFSISAESTPPTPAVTRIAPPDGSVGVGVNAALYIEFSGFVNELTIHEGTVRWTDGAGQGVPCTYEFGNWAQGFTSVAIKPHAPFTSLTEHTLTVQGVEDYAGRAVPTTTVRFTPSDTVDLTPPTIVRFSPPSSGAPRNTVVVAELSEPLDPGTVSAESFTLFEGATQIPAEVQLLADSKTIVLRPDDLLAANTSYTVRVYGNARIRDLSGLSISLPSSLQPGFNTSDRIDNAPPAILEAIPLDGAQGLALNGKMFLRFDRPVRQPTPGPGSVRLERSGVPVPVRIDMLDGNRIAEITPLSLLDPLTPYAWYAEGIVDLAGNPISAPISRTFSTGPTVDLTGPVVASTSPPNQSVGVSRTATFQFTFDEPLAPERPVLSYLSLQKLGTVEQLPYDLTVSPDGKTIIVTPTDPLPAQASISLSGIGYVRDRAGNRTTWSPYISITTGN